MAIEDAAVLGACSGTPHQSRKFPPFCVHTKIFGSYCNSPFVPRTQSTTTLITNQAKKRLPRATVPATQESSRLNQKIFHLPDGPDQRVRDDAMRAAMAAELEGKAIPDGNPNQWANRTKSRIQFDYCVWQGRAMVDE